MALYSDRVSNLKVKKSTAQANSVLATWDYPSSPDHFKDLKMVWYFGYMDNGTKVWTSSENTINNHTIHSYTQSVPSFDITKVKTVDIYVEITPEASNKKVPKYNKKGKKTGTTNEPAWKGVKQKSNTYQHNLVTANDPTVPSTPTVTKTGHKLKVAVTNYSPTSNYAQSVILQCRLNESTNKDTYIEHIVNIKGGSATYVSGTMSAGTAYQWRARGCSEKNGNGNKSSWSEWSEIIVDKPKLPRRNSFFMQTAKPDNTSSVTPIPNIVIKDYDNDYRYLDAYVIMWSADPDDLVYNRPKGQVEFGKSSSIEQGKRPFKSGDHIYTRVYLDQITEYARANKNTVWVSIRAKYGDTYSDYSKEKSYYVEYNAGTAPLAPTVWTSKSTYNEEEKIRFQWINNSTDGSYQSYYDLELTYFNIVRNITKSTTVPIDQSEPTYGITFNTIYDIVSLFNDYPGMENMDPGVFTIRYRLRVKCQYGVDEPSVGWSEWTTYKEFNVYKKPTLEFEHNGRTDWYWDPFDFRYDTIYTAYNGSPFAPEPDRIVDHFPIFIGVVSGPVPQQGLEYSFTITALDDYDMLDYDGTEKHVHSGEVIYSKISPPTKRYGNTAVGNYCLIRIDAWDILLANGIHYNLNAVVTMDSGLTAQCSRDFYTQFQDASFLPDADIVVDDELFTAYIEPTLVPPELEDGEESLELEDVVFNIFRRNYDGTMTEIATALNGGDIISIVDPHPSLNGASYRIIGMSKKTGEVQYVDKPGQEFNEKPIIIQWDDNWQPYDLLEDYVDEAEDEKNLMLYGQGLQGNMLKLPYNIDVTNAYDVDKELVSYIGRENPVAYYGTAKGESMTLNTVIPKSSKDIIFGLRKLSRYSGVCYIREPSGTGYWADVTVSFNINHLEVTVPVSITATRVEGGI